jgi:DNA-damage-inducible protein J
MQKAYIDRGRQAMTSKPVRKAAKTIAKTATVNTRIDAELKAAAEAVLRDLRLTPTDAVRLYYTQIALRRGLPFDLAVPNSETEAALKEAERRGGKIYRGSSRAIIEAMLNDAE